MIRAWHFGLAAMIGLAVGLTGCTVRVDPAPTDKDVAQDVLNKLIPACRDGVEYLVTPYYGPSQLVVPHLQPDGKPFPCQKAKP